MIHSNLHIKLSGIDQFLNAELEYCIDKGWKEEKRCQNTKIWREDTLASSCTNSRGVHVRQVLPKLRLLLEPGVPARAPAAFVGPKPRWTLMQPIVPVGLVYLSIEESFGSRKPCRGSLATQFLQHETTPSRFNLRRDESYCCGSLKLFTVVAA